MISVVIPLFNKGEYVGVAVNSALRQTVAPLEVIVVDDGSTDNGASVVQRFLDARVTLRRQENAGVSAARNAGIAEARGDWIAFLDADDKWDLNHLEQLAKLRQQFGNSELIGTAYREERKNSGIREVRPRRGLFEQLPDYFRLSAFNPIVYTSSIMARKSALMEIGGFPRGATHGEDLDTWARLALRSFPAYSSKVTVSYNLGVPGQATGIRMSRPPIIDTLSNFVERSADTHSAKMDARYYLNVNLPRYLAYQRIKEPDFLRLLDTCRLRPLGIGGTMWKLAARCGYAVSLALAGVRIQQKMFGNSLVVGPRQAIRFKV